MGWKMAMTIVRGATVEDLAKAGYAPNGQTTSGDEAAVDGFDPSLCVTAVGEDLVIVGQSNGESFGPAIAEALGVEVVTTLFMSTVDYYEWTVNGPDVHRSWVCGEGEVVIDEGTPLPEEERVMLLDEDSLFELVRSRTGIDTDDWIDATMHYLDATPVRATRPAGKRRGWFRRK